MKCLTVKELGRRLWNCNETGICIAVHSGCILEDLNKKRRVKMCMRQGELVTERI